MEDIAPLPDATEAGVAQGFSLAGSMHSWITSDDEHDVVQEEMKAGFNDLRDIIKIVDAFEMISKK